MMYLCPFTFIIFIYELYAFCLYILCHMFIGIILVFFVNIYSFSMAFLNTVT